MTPGILNEVEKEILGTTAPNGIVVVDMVTKEIIMYQ